MKKIGLLLLAVMLLVGCSQSRQEKTFMISKDYQFYALYNQDGKKLTDYSYKTFEEIAGVGYIVSNDQNQKALISFEGEEIIDFGLYETLEAADQMIIATKAIETKKDETKKIPDYNQYQTNNIYILDKKGEILHTANKETAIKKSALPILYNDKTREYTVLYRNGEELYKGQQQVNYVNQKNNFQNIVIGFQDSEKFYYFDKEDEKKNVELTFKEVGNYQILAQNETGVILNDKALKSMIYVDLEKALYYHNKIAITDAYFDDMQNIILTALDKVFVYPIGKAPILINSFYLSSQSYIVRSKGVYGPHNVYKEGKLTGELNDCQLYPDALQIYSEIFPVYKKDKGYQYFNFDSKQVIDQVYLEAQPFDENLKAIVKMNDKGYSLIDDKGAVLTKKYYQEIKYISSSYYAVYNKSGLYGIINSNGEEILPVEYTSLSEKPVIMYDEKPYLILNKNGRGYVYDINDDMKVIFSKEGHVVFDEKGYFSVGIQYYTFDGKLME